MSEFRRHTSWCCSMSWILRHSADKTEMRITYRKLDVEGWPWLDAKAALSLPSANGQGRENMTKGSWVKDRGRSQTDYCHGKKVEFIINQNQNRIMISKILKTPSPAPSSFPGSVSFPQWWREMGMGVMVSSAQVASSTAQAEESFPCSGVDSLPQEIVLHGILQDVSF